MSKSETEIGEDRISSLPDDLIHHILSFSDAQLAVQTSVLSKRWKLIWTTLPILNFFNLVNCLKSHQTNFFSGRNQDSPIFKLNLICNDPPAFRFKLVLLENFIKSVISPNVVDLTVSLTKGYIFPPHWLTSTCLKKLLVSVMFTEFLEYCCWHLPALTNLHLIQCRQNTFYLPPSYLTCLPSLQFLSLDHFELPESVTLPSLTTLHLASCKLPAKFWDCQALLTLTLDNITVLTDETRQYFLLLVNLRNLRLSFRKKITTDWYINCPHLVNLEINTMTSTPTKHSGKFIVSSQKICNFISLGVFPIRFEVSQLENVNVKLWDSTRYKITAPWRKMKKYYRWVTDMFPGLGSARIVALDLDTIAVTLCLTILKY